MNDSLGVFGHLAEVRAGLAGVLRAFDNRPSRGEQLEAGGRLNGGRLDGGRLGVGLGVGWGGGDAGFDDAGLIDLIRGLEDVKNAAGAVQVVAAVAFARSQKAGQVRRGVPADRVGRGVAEQVGLARRESPHSGAVFVGMAAMLVAEMPYTLAAMAAGVLSEYRARILVQGTSCVSREVRGQVDEVVCGDLARLAGLGTRELATMVRGETAGRDPAAVVQRIGRAEADRFVSLRPAPDCMTWLTALLPVARGVSVLAALRRAATTGHAGGDSRTRGQIMADELVMKVTGQAAPDAVPIGLHLVMPAGLLLTAGHDGPGSGGGGGGEGDGGGGSVGGDVARIVGYGPIPEILALRLVTAAPRVGSWIRRLYQAPGGRLVAMESRRRLFPKGLAEFIMIRDDTCRTPYCDAAIRHIDHVVAWADGGKTSAANGQGLCERCNHAKQAPGWTSRPTGNTITDPAGHQRGDPAGNHQPRRRPADPVHEVLITTPTGHHYTSRSPNTA